MQKKQEKKVAALASEELELATLLIAEDRAATAEA